jgi:glycine oxidase
MLAPYVEGRHHQALLGLMKRSAALFPEFVSRLSAATGLRVEYERSGTLEVALDRQHADALAEAKAWLDATRVSAELLDADALGAFEPALTRAAVAGLFIGAHEFVGVHSLIAALVQSAKLSGAVFETPIEAAAVESGRDAAEVRAGARTYTADAVVIATGSWSRQVRVAHVAALPVRPVRGQLLHLTWTGAPQPRRVVWGPRCYAVPFSNGSMLVGATAEDAGFDEHATVGGVSSLVSSLTELLPSAHHARLEGVRVGLRPALPDDLPAIGPVSRAPRVTMATGHFRNGVLLAPVTAEIVARSVLDGTLDPAVHGLSPDRFVGFRGPTMAS